MNPSNTEQQPVQEKEVIGNNLKHEISVSLGRNNQEIELGNLTEYLQGGRFLKGFTLQTPQRPAGFFKMSANPESQQDLEIVKVTKDQILRERNGTILANKIGIPSVNIITDFKETEGNKGIIEFEQLNSENGTFIPAEFVITAEPGFGSKAAVALMTASGKEIPNDISVDGVNGGDWRNKSLETFLVVWKESDKIFDPLNKDVVSSAIIPEKLKQIADATLSEIQDEIQKNATIDKKFFVHNDTAPNNMFFENATADNEGRTLLLDFEHSGYSNNRFAAQMTDLGNFYGRTWANKNMQQAFIKGVLDSQSEDSLEYKYNLIKSSIVFGTLFLAKYGIEPTHPEHQMSLRLLGNLEENLAFLDKTYQKETN